MGGREMESRSTLQLYRHKIGIGDEGIYGYMDRYYYSSVEQTH